MKPLFYCFLFALIFTSCDKDEDGTENDGWNLVLISLFSPENEEFQMGENVWEFNTVDKTVTITATKDISTYDLPSGTYTYVLENGIFRFTSGNAVFESFTYIEDGDSLILDAGSAFDAPRLDFRK